MAGSVIFRSNHPDALWPGVKIIFGKTYAEHQTEWTEIFDEIEGDKFQEKLMEATGFGYARVKTEGEAIFYDTDQEGYVTVATPAVFGIGYQVTREELEDDLYAEVSETRAKSLAFSMHTTIEQQHANVLLASFSTSQKLGDGQPICSASHPTLSGPQSNIGTTSADLSEASLEDLVKRAALAQNSKGLPIKLLPEKLIVSAADMFNAKRILGSVLRPGTANNDVNALKAEDVIPGGYVVNHYLGVEATQAWYMKTRVPKNTGLVSIWRRKPELERDNDFDTENGKAKTTARFVPTCGDWRALYANAGV